MYIAIDFDGTIVEHKYPKIGKDVPFALHFMRKFQEAGAKLILFTMRSGRELDDAVRYLRDCDIKMYGINHNPDQDSWTSSPKAYAHVYIDDAAFGCPMIASKEMDGRPMVDWEKVGPHILRTMEFLEKSQPIVKQGCHIRR